MLFYEQQTRLKFLHKTIHVAFKNVEGFVQKIDLLLVPVLLDFK